MFSRNLVTYGGLTVLVCATYPLALLGQFAVDMSYGEGQIVREVLYGYQRVLAAKLVDGWLGSLLWVIGFWVVVAVLWRVLLGLWSTLAVVAFGGIVTALSVAGVAQIPLLFIWLLFATTLLHGFYVAVRGRLAEPAS